MPNIVHLIAAIALAVVASLTPQHRTFPRDLTPCVMEDGPGPCFWDASTRGNGKGHSFWLDANQKAHYVS